MSNVRLFPGDCTEILGRLESKSVDLIFTSPPYFNAKREYSDYLNYESYLTEMDGVIYECNRLLREGRFLVINTSPILIPRTSRNNSSKRVHLPFDFHKIATGRGFDFIDDIIWMKPEGAGWSNSRGRRFAADRNPLQYKAVPVTEYIMVYRKKTDKLIDWNIRNHPDQSMVKDSKIEDGYEKTNVWRINPCTNSKHPAAFPVELAEKVIKYYSFKGDMVLDPFAGSGTVGVAASGLGRNSILIENKKEYVEIIKDRISTYQLKGNLK